MWISASRRSRGMRLRAFVESPVAAANEDADAVDGDGEVFRVGHGVGDLANAEGDVLRVGRLAVWPEAEVER